MFQKKTVFVLGAGVGTEYNMPLGKTLKESISSKLTAERDELWHSLTAPLNLSHQDGAQNYFRLKKLLSSNMDKAESIDNFLHTHSENPNLVLIGKTAIAACILNAERYSNMMPVDRTSSEFMYIRAGSDDETWLSRFCTMAFTGLVASEAMKAFENVTIVTFNYDRCIEQYIVGHIQSYLGITEDKAQTIANTLTIIHVYGKVGKLPWQSGQEPTIQFGAKPTSEQLSVISTQIRTFTERLQQDDTQQRIEAKLSQAELIVFSGFSFGTSNWEFIQNTKSGPTKVVIAGVLGISEQNQSNVSQRLYACLHPEKKVEIYTYGKGCIDLLYDFSTYFD